MGSETLDLWSCFPKISAGENVFKVVIHVKKSLVEWYKIIWTPDLSNIDQGNFIQVLKLATLFSEYNIRIKPPLLFIPEQTFGS